MSDPDIERALQRARAEGWERGFYDGCAYGRATERHDQQWDQEGPPDVPRNPHLPETPR